MEQGQRCSPSLWHSPEPLRQEATLALAAGVDNRDPASPELLVLGQCKA